MQTSGTIVLKRKVPYHLKFKKRLNVQRRPELFLSYPSTAVFIAVFLCMDKVVKYEIGEISLLTDRRVNFLNWEKLQLSEHSPKYINGIVLVQSMALELKVNYEIIVPSEST